MQGQPVDITQIFPAPRLARYEQVAGTAPADIAEFYVWAQSVALALYADIAGLEVLMRSAMARELSCEYTNEWYDRHDLFDDSTRSKIRHAWTLNGLGKLRRNASVSRDVVHGKLVASLMFGFWVALLGRGSVEDKKTPNSPRRIYDTLLWKPALRKAFPNAPSRERAERAVRALGAVRNRIAHHEHIVWGVQLPGQQQRVSVSDINQILLDLAGFIGADHADWITQHSTLQQRLQACPVSAQSLNL